MGRQKRIKKIINTINRYYFNYILKCVIILYYNIKVKYLLKITERESEVMKKMLKEIKRTLAILLAVAMVVTLMPEAAVTASAAEISTDESADAEVSKETEASGEEKEADPAEGSEDADKSEKITDGSDTEDESEAEGDAEDESDEAAETELENAEDVQEPEEETGADDADSDTKSILEGQDDTVTEPANIAVQYTVLAADGTGDDVYKENDGTVEVTFRSGVDENKKIPDETQDIVFTVKTAEGYKVTSVDYTFTDDTESNLNNNIGGNGEGFAEDHEFTISNLAADRESTGNTYMGDLLIKITVTQMQYLVSFQGTNAVVNVGDAENVDLSNVLYGESLAFQVVPKEGYKLRYVSTTGSTEGVIAPNEDGSYTYTPTEDTTIYVMAEEKAAVSVRTAYDDTNVELARVVETDDATALEVVEGGTITAFEDDILKFTVYLKEDSKHSITGITASDAGGEVSMPSKTETIGDKEYTVYTLDLTDRTEGIDVNVSSVLDEKKANTLILSVEGNPAGYTATIVGACNEKYPGVYKAGDRFVVEEEEISYQLTAAENYEITKVVVTYEDGFTLDLTNDVLTNNGQYMVDFKPGYVADLKVTVKGKATQAANTITFNNRSDYMTYKVAVNDNVTKVAGKTNVYAVAEGTREVQFSVTAKGKYKPVVEVNGVEQEALSVKNLVYTYSVAAQAFEEDAIVKISHELAKKTITVSYDEEEVTVDAKLGGKAYEAFAYSTDEAVYAVDVDASLVLVVTPLENCQITGTATKMGEAAAKKVSVKAAGGEITVKATDDAVVNISSKGIYRTILTDSGDNTLTSVKNVYAVSYDTVLKATAKKGVNTDVALSKVEILDGKKAANTTAEIKENGIAEITIAEKDAGRKLTVNLYTKTEDEKEEKVGTITISVPAKASKYAVAGVKSGKLTQTVDTVASYAIATTPKAADLSRLEAVVESESDAATAEIQDGKLVITTKAAEAKAEAAMIKLKDTSVDTGAEGYKEGDEVVVSFTLNTAAPAWAGKDTPGVKLSESDDVSLTLALSAAKKMTEPNTGSLYYKVEVTPKEGAPETSEEKTEYIKMEGASQTAKITVNSAGFGSGAAAKYDLKVTVVQTLGDSAPAGAKDEIFASKTKELKNAATKAPAYETKLTLKKGTTTVYTGQQDVLIATAQFSKNTTFTDVTVEDVKRYYSVDGGELQEETIMSFTVEDGKIYADVAEVSSLYTQKYTVKVTATAPEDMAAATATIDVTVVQGIQSISVHAASDSIYKADKKAAALKVTPQVSSSAKTKKFTYEIVGADSEEGNIIDTPAQIQEKVSVKNGTVTVRKDFVVSNTESENRFKVKVTAADYKGNETYGLSDVITIKAEALQLGGICIAKQTESGYEVLTRGNSALSADELQGASLLVLKKGTPERDVYTFDSSYIINTDEVKLTVKSSNKALSVSESNQISVSKAAKNVKITVSTTDGGKKSVVLDKLTITYAQREELGLSAWVKTPDNKEFNCIGQNEKDMTFTGTTDTEILLNLLQKEQTDGEWEFADDTNVLDYKIDVKGAKVLNKNGHAITIIANTEKATVTLTYQKGSQSVKQVYTITNEGFSKASAPSVKAKGNLVSYSQEEQTIQYTLGGKYNYKDKYVMVKADAAARAKQTWQYGVVEAACAGINGIMPIEEDGTFRLVFEAQKGLVTGSYKLQLTFGTIDEDGVFVADTKAVAVTLKVAQAKANGSYKPATAVKLSLKDGKAGLLKGTGKNVLYEYYYDVMNANINGKSNRFTEFFEIESDWTDHTATYYLKLKDGLTEEQLAYITSTAAKNDRIGYVNYSGTYGTAGVLGGNSGTTKITVNFTDTMGKYAISKATILSNETSAYVNVYLEKQLVEVADAYVDGNFSVNYVNGSQVGLTTAGEITVGTSTIAVYVVPKNSYYASTIAGIKNESGADSAEYIATIKKYGVKLVTEIIVKNAATTTDKIKFANLKHQFYMSKYRIIEHKYWAAVKFTSNYQFINTSMEVYADDSLKDLISFEMMQKDGYMYILLDKAKLDEMQIYGKKINVWADVYFGKNMKDELYCFELTMPSKALMTYEEAVANIKAQQADVEAQCQISYWEGTTEEEIKEQAAEKIWQAVRMHTPGDSDVNMDYPTIEGYTAPTATADGSVQVKLNLDKWNAQGTDVETEDSITYTLTISKLSITPADMHDAVESAVAAFTATNDTTAESLAAAIRQAVLLPSHLRLTVTNFEKIPATTQAAGSISFTITIFDVKYGGKKVTSNDMLSISPVSV